LLIFLDKKIIITGISGGKSHKLVLQFATVCHNVLAISRKTYQALIANPNISWLSVDLSDESEMQKVERFLFHSWSSVDIMIHNTGSLLLKPFIETS